MENSLESDVRSRFNGTGFERIHCEWLSQRDWWGVIAFATTTAHWDCFDVLKPLMTDLEYAVTVREIWCATNGLSPVEARRRLFDHGRKIRRSMWMTELANATFEALPDNVTIFRGCDIERKDGWCWSLEYATAKYFAFDLRDDDQPGNRVVLEGIASKRDIFALFWGENWEEYEVVVPGRLVTITSVTPMNTLP